MCPSCLRPATTFASTRSAGRSRLRLCVDRRHPNDSGLRSSISDISTRREIHVTNSPSLRIVLCLLLSLPTPLSGQVSAAAEGRARGDEQSGTSRVVLLRSHQVGGTWRDADGAVVGLVDGASRGVAIADDAPFAGAQTLEAE